MFLKNINNDTNFLHIDALKIVGLFLIILAHVSPPPLLFDLRTFDVPLMVILSGYLGFFSYQRYIASGRKAGQYILKRIVRIAVPTWIFCFCLYVPVSTLGGEKYTFSQLLSIFLFQRQPMGYIWIALVYILSATVVPFVFHLGVNKRKTFCIFIGAYVVYELLVMHQIGINNALISSIVYQIIPYGLLTLLGMYMACTKSCKIKLVVIISGIIFFLHILFDVIANGEIATVQSAKYPATLYYLSYGVFISLMLLLLFEKILPGIFRCSFFRFISRSSYWIYLWHIMYISIGKVLFPSLAWYLRYAIVIICSIGTVWIQHKCIDFLQTHTRCPVTVLSFFKG